MRISTTFLFLTTIFLFCLLCFYFGGLTCNPWIVAAGGIGICYLLLRIACITVASRKRALPVSPFPSRKSG